MASQPMSGFCQIIGGSLSWRGCQFKAKLPSVRSPRMQLMSVSSDIVRDLRRERGWSQEQLATIAGLSERTIQRIETCGDCSLDSKMALASAFELPPSALSKSDEPPATEPTLLTDWAGAAALLICGLIPAVVIMLTATNGAWEVASLFSVIGITVVLTVISYGARATYAFFDRTSWIVRYPVPAPGLIGLISQAKSVIATVYAVGAFASVVTGIAILIYAPVVSTNPKVFVPILLKPMIDAALFSEFWIRPFKRKLQRMLANQLEVIARGAPTAA
jgi:transcriptional regulator with XRE-family HTH domain